ncbi:putative PIN and TRAM-domain containing protein YacL [bacterium HR17]|uniref:Putative PIN and TRAM-domain containing protein YacL n=1 Tax=Candidatus Fervidibacter japonicus TaxID=2035412 RepID=A0A2H5X9C4_9BACT|nr:putative PIN and TRAM-domain containing protein YacL [bacterium HR17]
MNNLQQWGYRLFLVAITTALAFALGWLGSVAATYYAQALQSYNLKLTVQQRFLVDVGFVAIGVLTALLLGSWFTQRLWTLWESLEALSPVDKVAVLFGAIVGLALAYLILLAPMMLLWGRVPPLPLLALIFAFTLVIVYFAVHTLLRVRDAISLSFPQIAQMLRGAPEAVTNHRAPRLRDKVLDTSVIIDGRLADIVRTGFLEGRLIVPSFVLNELQMIADSEDELRRARGRRGLAVLETLKSLPGTVVEVVDEVSPEVEAAPSTDLKLVRLAKELNAALVTNDNNLQKIAELQGVPVLCVNELATALKPVVLPGEELTVVLQRPGKEPGQGVGYLDDGTMVVVERGRPYLGHEVKIKVTSVLQSPVGKMIFGEFKEIVRRNVIKVEGGDLFDDDISGARRRSGQKT